ncbi:MAG: hypothetical protein NC394_01780 [Bacteroides sp.]|nr:hypothetical protein [Bacteroides sp.]
MSKKNKKNGGDKAAVNYYDLKTDAVERLVNAKNAPKVSDEEIEKYTRRHKLRIPSWLKIIFIKFWFSGAVCYFFLWGLGTYISGLDLMAVLAIGLGVSTDLMVNHVLRHFEPEKGAYDKWMMIPFRKFWTIFLNVLYAVLLLFCVIQFYNAANTLLVGSAETADTVAIGVEPILFGLLYMGFDMLFITIKNGLIKVFKDAGDKVAGTESKAQNGKGLNAK